MLRRAQDLKDGVDQAVWKIGQGVEKWHKLRIFPHPDDRAKGNWDTVYSDVGIVYANVFLEVRKSGIATGYRPAAGAVRLPMGVVFAAMGDPVAHFAVGSRTADE